MTISRANAPLAIVALFLAATISGCGDDGDAKSNEHTNNGGGFFPGMNTGLDDLAGGRQPAGSGNPPTAPSGGAASSGPADSQPPIAATQDNTGRKGRDYGGGIITQPIASYFRAQDKLNLGFIKHALDLYRELNDGPPRSHEEFVEQILNASNLKLPEAADPNYLVRYSPETGWLILVPKDGSQ